MTAPAKRELVRWMVTRGLSERRCLGLVGMSASALRYEPRADRNQTLRERIVALAQRHRRYGVGMIYLKLRQAAELVSYKRVERLYRLEQLHIRPRRRKKLIAAERHPLLRPALANEVWSMDFVFDRVATGRSLKCLTVVDDATHEVIAVPVEHSMGGEHLTRVIETWRREYNEDRPRRSLGGLTPAQYAKQLAIRAVTMPEDSKAPCY